MSNPLRRQGSGTRIGRYQLGKELGKGGYGVVYQGLDTEAGTFVAVKQVSTENVPKDQLTSIHLEIILLKKLQHDNIVRYFDSVETGDTLNIVLEFVENGSLSDIIKRFGTFSEPLAVMYISQVLSGLDYLHTQGVIHRDIKAANILTTKNGLVKLADFGVALDAGEQDGEDGIVGTPYWMAPEIIEMAGPTSKCDIWSVGCVVIELITSEPPYYDLAPMAALFRIVQDVDGPKIPSGVSPVLRDFLRQCFHKQPNFRKAARELLVHPWLRVKRGDVQCEPSVDTDVQVDDSTRSQMKEAMQATLKISKIRQATLRKNITLKRPTARNVLDIGDIDESMVDMSAISVDVTDKNSDSEDDWDGDIGPADESVGNVVAGGNALQAKLKAYGEMFKDEEIGDDFWGDDDEGGSAQNPAANLASRSPATKLKQFQEADDDDDFQNFDIGGGNISNAGQEEEAGGGFSDNGSGDESFGDDEDFEKSFTIKSAKQSPGENRSGGSSSNKAENLGDAHKSPLVGKPLSALQGNDANDDDFDDLEFDGELSTVVVCKNTAFDGENDPFYDPFADPLEMFDEEDYKQDAERDAHEKRMDTLGKLLDALSESSGDAGKAGESCDQLLSLLGLLNLLGHRPDLKNVVLKDRAMLIVHMFDRYTADHPSLPKVLGVVYSLVRKNPELQRRLAIMGIVSRLVIFLTEYFLSNEDDGNNASVLLANKILLEFLHGGNGTALEIVIASGGLKALVYLISLVAKDKHLELVYSALDGIQTVLSSSEGLSKNNLCNLFCEMGLLPGLAFALSILAKGTGKEPRQKKMLSYANNVVDVLTFFANGDSGVKFHLTAGSVLDNLIAVLQTKGAGPGTESLAIIHTKLLQVIRLLAMDSTTLESMEKCGIVKTLVFFMTTARHRSVSLLILFYLVRLSTKRQVAAAKSGIIPLLEGVIDSNDPLRQTALQMFCDMAHSSDVTRQLLWENKGVHRFLSLLTDDYWFRFSLFSLSKWLSNDTERVEAVLVEKDHLKAILNMFQSLEGLNFESCLGSLRDMVYKSSALNRALRLTPGFIEELVSRLQKRKTMVLLSLLKLLKLFYEQCREEERAAFVETYKLYPIVQEISENDNMVLVKELSRQILQLFVSAMV